MSNVLEMPGVTQPVKTEGEPIAEARSEERDEAIALRTKGIRMAVEMIVDNSRYWSNEIETALAELPKRERAEFLEMAAEAVGHIGFYMAWAMGTYGRKS